MKVYGFLKDVGGAGRVTARRQSLFQSASAEPQTRDPINELARALHPGPLALTVTDVRDVSPTARKLRFAPKQGRLPVFQCGQYLSLELKIGQTVTTRPYSICSAPYQARQEDGFVEITVRNGKSDGFAANWLYANTKAGDEFTASLPFGQFYYEPLRDSRHIVGLAGGSGITPFYSMAQEIAAGKLDAELTILYGSVTSADIILKNELEAVACDKVHYVNVISGEKDYPGEKGFLTREVISKYAGPDSTFFVCGPLPMYKLVARELAALNVPPRRIRMEVFGAPKDVSAAEGYPKDKLGEHYTITVVRGIREDEIPARASEPVAVALERAGIPIPTRCRSGACGYCHSRLLSGEIFVPADGDGRRRADRELGFFHACSSYPLSDLRIKIPIL
jgi:ferredoxin-NADP reductase